MSAPSDFPAVQVWDGRPVDRSLIVDRTTTVRFLALTTLVLSQTFDLGTFQWMVRQHGRAAELNPIVLGLHDSFGMIALVGVKAALIVLIGSLFVAAWSRQSGIKQVLAGPLPLAFAIMGGLIGGITNAATILR